MFESVLIWLLVWKQRQLMKQQPGGATRRGQHPKHHGCLWAEYTVEQDVPPAMQVGLFARPQRYECIIRFSNGAAEDDREDDVRGMAIKLLSVPGEKLLEEERHEETMDFVLADNEVFFAKDLRHLIRFVREKNKGKSTEELIKTHPALRGFKKQAPDSPLAAEYWSQTPYRLRNTLVRYSVKPAADNASRTGDRSSPDFLRLAMVEHLKSDQKSASFDFYVQAAPDASAKWENDPTLAWDKAPPAVKVASISIPPQQFDTPEQQSFCEHLSFTPWHCLPAHRPVGQINRARRVVYRASSRLRHRTTKAPIREPTIADRPGQ